MITAVIQHKNDTLVVELPKSNTDLQIKLLSIGARTLPQNIKLFVQGGGMYETVPITVLTDKTAQTQTPLTSATGKKGTLDEMRVNTNRISFRYTLPDYLEPSAQRDTDWKEYV